MYTASNLELHFTRVVLDDSGVLERLTWNYNKWVGFWSIPKDQCDCVIRTKSAVQILTVIHMISKISSAHAYPGLNPSQPVIGT